MLAETTKTLNDPGNLSSLPSIYQIGSHEQNNFLDCIEASINQNLSRLKSDAIEDNKL